MGSIPRCPIFSHSMVYVENNSYFQEFGLHLKMRSSKYVAGGLHSVLLHKIGVQHYNIILRCTSNQSFRFIVIIICNTDNQGVFYSTHQQILYFQLALVVAFNKNCYVNNHILLCHFKTKSKGSNIFCNGLIFIDLFYYHSYCYNYTKVINLLTEIIIHFSSNL